MKTQIPFFLKAATALALSLACSAGIAKDDYPTRPIKVVVPYTPGGVSDTVTRLIMQKVGEQLKGTVVVDNVPGANGQIGSAAVARAAPDGYSFLVVVAAHAINPSLYTKMPYSPLKDLTGVSQFGHIPLLVVSSAQIPPTNMKEFVSWAQQPANRTSFASSGIGSGAHLSAELFAQTAKLQMLHVPYKGMAPALPDLFSGQVAMAFDSMQTMMPQVRAGKLRALAVTSAKRWPSAPEVPTMAEVGYPEMTGGSWIGLLAPSGTPAPMLQKISAEVQTAIDSPEIRAKLIEFGIDPVGGTPQVFDAFIRSEASRWAEVIKKAGVKLD